MKNSNIKINDKLNNRLNIRCSHKLIEQLRAESEEANMDLSVFVRMRLDNSMDKPYQSIKDICHLQDTMTYLNTIRFEAERENITGIIENIRCAEWSLEQYVNTYYKK